MQKIIRDTLSGLLRIALLGEAMLSLRCLSENDRTRAIFELAISQPALDMPELLWKVSFFFFSGKISQTCESIAPILNSLVTYFGRRTLILRYQKRSQRGHGLYMSDSWTVQSITRCGLALLSLKLLLLNIKVKETKKKLLLKPKKDCIRRARGFKLQCYIL